MCLLVQSECLKCHIEIVHARKIKKHPQDACQWWDNGIELIRVETVEIGGKGKGLQEVSDVHSGKSRPVGWPISEWNSECIVTEVASYGYLYLSLVKCD